MSYVKALRCRKCERDYPIESVHICEFYFGLVLPYAGDSVFL